MAHRAGDNNPCQRVDAARNLITGTKESPVATKRKPEKPTTTTTVSMVDVRLPDPLPKGLKVIYSEAQHGYTLAATTRQGIRNMLQLGKARRGGRAFSFRED